MINLTTEDIEYLNQIKLRDKLKRKVKAKIPKIPKVKPIKEKKVKPIVTKKPRNTYDPLLPKEYKQYLIRANNRKIPIELTIDQFYTLINNNCEYCNNPGPNGIDRIDSSKGYILDNCVPCCTQCNTMKFIHNTDKFLAQVERIYRHSIEKHSI